MLKRTASYHSKYQLNNNSYTSKLILKLACFFLQYLVFKADSKILQKELDDVRNYFVQMYEKDKANNAFKLLKGIINDDSFSTKEFCTQVRKDMTSESRVQLIHFLFTIVKSNGYLADVKTQNISNNPPISQPNFEYIKAMVYDNIESAYQIL